MPAPSRSLAPRAAVLVAHQPAYLPWCGYFSRLLDVSQMIILDHVQFAERGYQHRNRIVDRTGTRRWVTVPVRRQFGQRLCDVRIAETGWARRHWRTLVETYGKTPFWLVYADCIAELYARSWTRLVDLDLATIRLLLDALDLNVALVRSSTLAPHGARTDMLIDLCHRTTTRILRVGTGAVTYLDPVALRRAGIAVEVATFTQPPYAQRHRGPFVAGLSVLDLLMHCGPAARDVLAEGARVSPWSAAA